MSTASVAMTQLEAGPRENVAVAERQGVEAMDVRGAAARVQTETRKSVGGGQGSSTNRELTELGSNERVLVLIRYS